MAQTCTACARTDEETSFPTRGARCLDCRREAVRRHYRANRAYYLAKARRRNDRVIAEAREWLLEYLSSHPCADCGMHDPRVLEFDHDDPGLKSAPVAVIARSGYSLDRLQLEVSKCTVRCANCHRLRTHEQRGWWVATQQLTA